MSYAAGSRWESVEQPHHSAEAVKCQAKHRAVLTPSYLTAEQDASSLASADAGYDVCRLHPQPAACRES